MDQCGQRLRGPPGDIRKPYQKFCFDSAFHTPGETNLVPCVASYHDRNRVCPKGAACEFNGRLKSGGRTLAADFTPYAYAPISEGQARQVLGAAFGTNTRCPHGMFQTLHDGEHNIMCAVGVPENVKRNCANALKSVWQCDRYLARGDRDGYNKCRQMEQCFQYDIQTPDGNTIPVGVKANDTCLAAAEWALAQCGTECANGLRSDRPPCVWR